MQYPSTFELYFLFHMPKHELINIMDFHFIFMIFHANGVLQNAKFVSLNSFIGWTITYLLKSCFCHFLKQNRRSLHERCNIEFGFHFFFGVNTIPTLTVRSKSSETDRYLNITCPKRARNEQKSKYEMV